MFPFTHELELEAVVGDGHLTMDTTLYATGSDPVPVAFGYHPYLRIPGTTRATWQMKLGAFRRLVLDDRMIPTGAREPVGQRQVNLGDSTWDDAFDGSRRMPGSRPPPATRPSRSSSCADTRLRRCSHRRAPTTSALSR